jgi:hypothetical protein
LKEGVLEEPMHKNCPQKVESVEKQKSSRKFQFLGTYEQQYVWV